MPRGPQPGRCGYAILGAGCAGLSLCHYLLEGGVEATILILDRKEAFTDDRTWCFWDVEGTPFSSRAVRSWDSWTVRAEGREVVHTSDRYPYLCPTGADFYEEALQKISTRGNVTVRLGEVVQAREEIDDGVLAGTSAGSYLVGNVLDGRGLPPDSRALKKSAAGEVLDLPAVPQASAARPPPRLRTRDLHPDGLLSGPGGVHRTPLPVALETLLLLAFFAVVPAVLAVGLYFALWHAPRHIARLVLLDPAPALSRFVRDAAPLTGLTLALLAGLYLVVPAGEGNAGSLLAVYLVLISALTLPHAVVVSYMDARQGLWGDRPTAGGFRQER